MQCLLETVLDHAGRKALNYNDLIPVVRCYCALDPVEARRFVEWFMLEIKPLQQLLAGSVVIDCSYSNYNLNVVLQQGAEYESNTG